MNQKKQEVKYDANLLANKLEKLLNDFIYDAQEDAVRPYIEKMTSYEISYKLKKEKDEYHSICVRANNVLEAVEIFYEAMKEDLHIEREQIEYHRIMHLAGWEDELSHFEKVVEAYKKEIEKAELYYRERRVV